MKLYFVRRGECIATNDPNPKIPRLKSRPKETSFVLSVGEALKIRKGLYFQRTAEIWSWDTATMKFEKLKL